MNSNHSVTISETDQAVNITLEDAIEAKLEESEASSGHECKLLLYIV